MEIPLLYFFVFLAMAAIVEIIQEPWLMKQIAIENVVEIQMSTVEAMSILRRVTTLFMELEGYNSKILFILSSLTIKACTNWLSIFMEDHFL